MFWAAWGSRLSKSACVSSVCAAKQKRLVSPSVPLRGTDAAPNSPAAAPCAEQRRARTTPPGSPGKGRARPPTGREGPARAARGSRRRLRGPARAGQLGPAQLGPVQLGPWLPRPCGAPRRRSRRCYAKARGVRILPGGTVRGAGQGGGPWARLGLGAGPWARLGLGALGGRTGWLGWHGSAFELRTWLE